MEGFAFNNNNVTTICQWAIPDFGLRFSLLFTLPSSAWRRIQLEVLQSAFISVKFEDGLRYYSVMSGINISWYLGLFIVLRGLCSAT